MIWAFLRWLTGNLAGQLRAAHEAKLKAANETERLIADTAIEEIKARIAAPDNAKEIRLATASFWEMRLLTAVIAGCAALHYLAVTLDTVFMFGWRIPKYPPPFDEYQGTILLSFFGVQGVAIGVTAIAAAIRGRK
jgi:hypothetical protein